MLFLPLCGSAQKISMGSCTTRDGGEYKGEMVAGKPHGKGNTVFKNGDTYEGEYAKGKRRVSVRAMVSILSPMVKSMRASGSRTSSTVRERSIS